MADFEPFISFPDQSKSFTYGVEFGRLLEKMERGDSVVMNNGIPIRIENVELVKHTCAKLAYIPTFGKEQDGWVSFMAIRGMTTQN